MTIITDTSRCQQDSEPVLEYQVGGRLNHTTFVLQLENEEEPADGAVVVKRKTGCNSIYPFVGTVHLELTQFFQRDFMSSRGGQHCPLRAGLVSVYTVQSGVVSMSTLYHWAVRMSTLYNGVVSMSILYNGVVSMSALYNGVVSMSILYNGVVSMFTLYNGVVSMSTMYNWVVSVSTLYNEVVSMSTL